MQKYLTVHAGRMAAHEDFLFYYEIPKELIDEQTKLWDQTSLSGWEYFVRTIDGKQCRFIYFDSIDKVIRDKYGMPNPKTIPKALFRQINPDEIRQSTITTIYNELDITIGNALRNPESNLALINKYLKRDFNVFECKMLVKKHVVLEACIRQYKLHSGELIYLALDKLRTDKKHSVDVCFPELSCRTLYRWLENTSLSDIDKIVTHGGKGKPSNFGITCPETVKIVAALGQHFNTHSDRKIALKTNAIILALPHLYNNGHTISRATVNNIKNGKHKNSKALKHLILAGRLGDGYVRDTMLQDMHLAPTAFPLDKVEIDFTGIHATAKTDKNKKTRLVMCKFKDACSGAILAHAVGKTECYELFNRTFRRFLRKTKYRLAYEFVFDNSKAYEHHDFVRVAEFLDTVCKLTFTGNPRAKGGIESHFSAVVSAYMPETVGALGGNITNRGKHRPRKEVRVLLKDLKYLNDQSEWDKLIHDMDEEYNATPYTKKDQAPMTIYDAMDKPHAIQLNDTFAAYLSYYRTNRKFSQTVYKIDYANYSYTFGREMKEYVDNEELYEFMKNRTDDIFDIYIDPDYGPHHAFIFEADTAKFVDKTPLLKFEYGNAIDHAIDPAKLDSLLENLDARAKVSKNIKKDIKSIFDDIEAHTGCPAYTLIKEITGKKPKSNSEDGLLDELIEVLRGGKANEINPYQTYIAPRRAIGRGSKSRVKPMKASQFTKPAKS